MKLEFAQGPEIGPMVTAPAVTGAAGPMVTVPAVTRAAAPPLRFDLPRSVQRQLVLAAAGYIAIMGFAFRQGAGMGLILGIFVLVLLGYFGLPSLMARASGAPGRQRHRGAWGIDTASGHLPGRAAWAQIMTVPLLMLGWAMVIAILH